MSGPTIISGRIVTADAVLESGHLVMDGPWIGGVDEGPATGPPGEVVSVPPGSTVIPGLVDIHCHGGGGGEFGPNAESAARAARFHHRAGTTSVMASLVSAPATILEEGIRVCGGLVEAGAVIGVHLEGPFLSPMRCGAQDPSALIDVDLDLVERWLASAPGTVRCMTFAPELEGAVALAETLVMRGVIPAIGHTDATFEQTRRVLDAIASAGGRSVATHLFNAMAPLHHRAPGPVVALLAAAAAGHGHIELIADGRHLDPGIVHFAMSAAGADRAVLVSDAMAATGCPDGRYALGGMNVDVVDTVPRLAGSEALAGGACTLAGVLAWTAREAGVELADAVRAASYNPARALGVADRVGRLEAGLRADVVIVDAALRVSAVWRGGERLV